LPLPSEGKDNVRREQAVTMFRQHSRGRPDPNGGLTDSDG